MGTVLIRLHLKCHILKQWALKYLQFSIVLDHWSQLMGHEKSIHPIHRHHKQLKTGNQNFFSEPIFMEEYNEFELTEDTGMCLIFCQSIITFFCRDVFLSSFSFSMNMYSSKIFKKRTSWKSCPGCHFVTDV